MTHVDGDRGSQQGKFHEDKAVETLEKLGYCCEVIRGEGGDYRAKFEGKNILDIFESKGKYIFFSITSKGRYSKETVENALKATKECKCKGTVVIFTRKIIDGTPKNYKSKTIDKTLFLIDANKWYLLNSKVYLIENWGGKEIRISDETSIFLTAPKPEDEKMVCNVCILSDDLTHEDMEKVIEITANEISRYKDMFGVEEPIEISMTACCGRSAALGLDSKSNLLNFMKADTKKIIKENDICYNYIGAMASYRPYDVRKSKRGKNELIKS